MFETAKKVIKVGTGVLMVTAAAAATAGYWAGKAQSDWGGGGMKWPRKIMRRMKHKVKDKMSEWNADDDESEGEEESSDTNVRRKQAIKDIVEAGKIMKQAWSRIERDAKVIAKNAATMVMDGEGDEEDE